MLIFCSFDVSNVVFHVNCLTDKVSDSPGYGHHIYIVITYLSGEGKTYKILNYLSSVHTVHKLSVLIVIP